MARPDFRAAAARRLSEERELSPAIVSLLSPDSAGRQGTVQNIPLDRIESNPDQPRVTFVQETIDELAASIREHGVLQPILVRPLGPGAFQLVAGERRWRASRQAGLDTIPALVEHLDDETAMEIAIIENLQREDLSPLDEAAMYDRMIREHGYSIRKLAEKLGKDKGYLENRLRLADAPDEDASASPDGGAAAAASISAQATHPDNHGAAVSEAARTTTPDGFSNHGAYVSSIALDNSGQAAAKEHRQTPTVPTHPTPTVPQHPAGH